MTRNVSKCPQLKDDKDAERAPLDVAYLQGITAGDLQLETEILRLFLIELPRMQGLIENAACLEEWRVAMHTLKGTARSIGAWKLADLASFLETQQDIFQDPILRENSLKSVRMDMDHIQNFLQHKFRLSQHS